MRGDALRFSGPIVNRECRLTVQIADPSSALIRDASGRQRVDVSRLVSVEAIIDTGATASLVSPELSSRLALKVHGKVRVGVVGGKDGSAEVNQAAALIVFPSIKKDGLLWKVMPLLIGPSTTDMLFGMQELYPGTLTVDCGAGEWEWRVPNRYLPHTAPIQ